MIDQLMYGFGFAFGLLFAAIIMHEAGHAWMMSAILKKKINIKYDKKSRSFQTGIPSDYHKLTIHQYIWILMSGIVVGALPLIIFTIISKEPIMILAFAGYGIGCYSDLKKMIKVAKYDPELKLREVSIN